MITLRALDPAKDAALAHDWLSRPYAHFWGMQHLVLDEVRDYLRGVTADPWQQAWIGERDGRPVVLAETYDPAHSELATHYDVAAGDRGMHLLTAPPDGPPEHGFTRAVITAVVAHCFADPAVRRVVVEPDVRNTRVHALNAHVGFRPVRELELSDKRALFSVCTRSDFDAAVGVRV